MRRVIAVIVAVFGLTTAQADDPEFQRKQLYELLAACQTKGHKRAKELTLTSSTQPIPDKAGFLICTDTAEFKQLSRMYPSVTPQLIEMLDGLPESQAAAKFYLCGALAKITRADPARLYPDDTKLPLIGREVAGAEVMSKQWVRWWEGRGKTSERFTAAAKKWAEAKEKDKGLLSTTRRVLNDKTGKVEETTERTAFADAHADVLAFGLDAIPEIIGRFEKKDYTLKLFLDEVTDHHYSLDEPLDWAVDRHIKWWRDPSKRGEASQFQLPPVSAAKLK